MSSTSEISQRIPFLGAGLSYRRRLNKSILDARERIDFLEIIVDDYVHFPSRIHELEALCKSFKVIPHGVGLSIGSIGSFDIDYLNAIKRISDITQSPFYSEHLCITRVPGINLGHLSPIWFTKKLLQNAIDKVSYVQDYLNKPLILENISSFFEIPEADMSQAAFFNNLVESTGCGILLDITNVHINSINHEFDPLEFLYQMPLKKVAQIHIAGGYWSEDLFVDSHSEPVQDSVWQLLEALQKDIGVPNVILEHDSNFPEFDYLLEQIEKAKKIVLIS